MTPITTRLRAAYHTDDLPPDNPIRVAIEEIERLAAERDALRAVLEIARNRLDECGADVGYIDALLGGEK